MTTNPQAPQIDSDVTVERSRAHVDAYSVTPAPGTSRALEQETVTLPATVLTALAEAVHFRGQDRVMAALHALRDFEDFEN
jgi:hypothetical protein